MASKDIAIEIKEIFDQNKIDDLKSFLKKRQNLNAWNVYLLYLFHLIQSAGILTTTVAAGYDQKYLIWIGVALNMLATLIDVYEKTNNSIIKKLMADITKIREGNYVDEGAIVETAEKQGVKESDNSPSDNSVTTPLLKSNENNRYSTSSKISSL